MGILRLILALSVVIAHSSPLFGLSFTGSEVAVQSFFIISGFYMSFILNEKYTGKNNSYSLFITNRFLRIYPLYWLILFLAIAYAMAISIYSKGIHLSFLGIYYTYYYCMDAGTLILLACANILIFFQDLIMFLGFNTVNGHLFFTADFQNTDPALYRFVLIPQAWSLAIEICFYLVAPFILKRNIKFISVLIFLSLALRFFLYRSGLDHDPWTYRFFPTELVFFLLGYLSYRIYKWIGSKEINTAYMKLMLCFIIVFSMVYSLFFFPGKMYLYFLCFILCIPFIFLLTKEWKADAYIGELSYPIYISHLLVLTVINILNLQLPGGMGLTLILATIIFSILLNALVVNKIEDYRKKRLN